MRALAGLSLLFTLCAAPCFAEQTSAKLVDKVRFGDVELLFAFKGGQSPMSFKEYIHKGQTLETWTEFAGIHQYPHIKDPFEFAQTLAQSIKQDNPLSQSAIMYNEKTGSVILDFITWNADMKFVEFNIWKFEHNGKNGIIGYQYAERAYKDQREFLVNLRALREKSIKTMIDDGLVVVERETRNVKISSKQRLQSR